MSKDEFDTIVSKFISDNNGKYIDSLPAHQRQCFDVPVALTNILGVPHVAGNPSPFPYPNASQIYTDYGSFQAQYFDRVANTTDYVPQLGDIVVWDKAINGNIGHVAVANGTGDTNTFDSLDQNWVTGSVAKIIHHNYNYVLGALRFKTTGATPTPQPPMNDEDKARLQAKVDTDKYLVYLKSVGRIVHDDSKLWLLDANDPEKYLGLLKAIWSEREDYRKKAEAVPDTAAATEAGRKAGVQSVKDVVSKLS